MSRRGPSRTDGPNRRRSVEWPSIALCAGIYGGFLTLTWFHDRLPGVVVAALGAMLLALHASMQHEFIHGHPTRWRRLNHALGFVPLSLWLPFASYRMTHLVHHCDESLTDPFDDPESFYWSHDGWVTLGPLGRLLVRIHSTLAGRLVLGPAWTIARYLKSEAKAVWRDAPAARGIWLRHGLGVAAVMAWVWGACGMSPAFYVLAIVYPGVSILLLRSFAEHRAELSAAERTAIVEDAPIFGFLFLYNNLHAAHHERPLIPWYELPRWYRSNRDRLVAENGGLVYAGYAEVARRYLFVPHHVAVHPFRAGMREAPGSRRPRGLATIFARLVAKKAGGPARFVP